MIKIRKANKKDFEAFWKLEKEFREYNNKHEIIESFKYKLVKPKIKKYYLKIIKPKINFFIFLEENGKTIGYLFGVCGKRQNGQIYKGGWGYLDMIFISEKYRGKGYAKLLINEFLKFLKRRKIKICTLHTDSYNKSAIKAYKKIGFKGPIQYKFFRKI